MLAIFSTFIAVFRPLTGNKTSPNYFFLVEEVLVDGYWFKVKMNISILIAVFREIFNS